MMVVVAAIVLMLLIKAFVVQVYRIPSSSMEDTLLTGDRVLVNKLVYHVRGIARGDIVVFSGYGSWGTTTGAPDPSPPGNPLLRVAYDVLADIGVYSTQTYYIKRVIGLPGDHVVCCVNGKVTVNGVPLDETSYLFPGASPSMQPFKVIVPPGRLWVMGDNRAISDDSRGHMSGRIPGHGHHPGEQGVRPRVHDHLAAVADRRPADSRHIPAGRAACRGGGRGGLGPGGGGDRVVAEVLAKTHPDDLAVLAVSLIGPRNQVAKLVRHLELLPLVMPALLNGRRAWHHRQVPRARGRTPPAGRGRAFRFGGAGTRLR